MRKTLLLIVVGCLLATPVMAAETAETLAPTVERVGNFITITCTDSDSLNTTIANTYYVDLYDAQWNFALSDSGLTTAGANTSKPVYYSWLEGEICNVSTTTADSISLALYTSANGTVWRTEYAVANDGVCLNGAEAKSVRLTYPGRFLKIVLTNLKGSDQIPKGVLTFPRGPIGATIGRP